MLHSHSQPNNVQVSETQEMVGVVKTEAEDTDECDIEEVNLENA